MKRLKNFIVALTLVFMLSGISFAGQLDMPAAPPPPPPQQNGAPTTEIGTASESPTEEETLAESVMGLIRDFLSIF